MEMNHVFIFPLASALIYFMFRALYRLTFHPLRSFPGPRLRAISDLPHAYAGFKGLQGVAVRDLHRQYGEVVRITPNQLSFMTSSSWKDIHGHTATKRFSKHGYFRVRKDAQPLLTADDADYSRQKTALSHAFSDRAIMGQERTLTQLIETFIENLNTNARAGKTLNMTDWLTWLSFDFVGKLALDVDFDCVKNADNHPWVLILKKWFRATAFSIIASAFGIFAPVVLLFANWKDLMGIKIHLQKSAEAVRDRLRKGVTSDQTDMWSYVLRAGGDKLLTLGEMEVNAAAIVIAATAPVSDTLCGAVYLLARNQAKLQKLRSEIEMLAATERDITLMLTKKMEYLSAVVNETLRCYTPTPGGGRRKAPPDGAMVSGYFVPGGTIVTVYQLPSFTLSNNFALPSSFLPERWLPVDHPGRPLVTLSDKQEAFQPFGYGPKACIGKGIALAEIKLIIARLVWKFDFELVDDGFAIEKQRSFVFRDKPALNVRLMARIH